MMICCSVCGADLKSADEWLCAMCAKEYGLDPRDVSAWPEWAVFMQREEELERLKDNPRDVNMSDLPDAELAAYG